MTFYDAKTDDDTRTSYFTQRPSRYRENEEDEKKTYIHFSLTGPKGEK